MLRGILLGATNLIAALFILTPAVLADGDSYKLLKLKGHFAKWYAAQKTDATVISYAFANEIVHHEHVRNCGTMQPVDKALVQSNISMAQFRDEFINAAHMWEDAANIRFVEAASPQSADILIGAQVKGIGRAFTNVELTAERISPGTRRIRRSLICLNPDMPWKIGFDGDLSAYDLRYTLAHELGHAIGLDHPDTPGSLMFYKYDETQHGLTPGDMAGAAMMYGAGPKLAKTGAGASSAPTELANEKSGDPEGEHDTPSSFGLGAKP